MIDGSGLDKHRVDFAHNYTRIRLRCPECVRTVKGKNHVKLFKNTAGLWWHFKKEHGQVSNSLFMTEDVKEVLRAISKAQSWGMFADVTADNCNTTTSSSLLYDGRPPRKDVLIRLEEIANLLKSQSAFYPSFSHNHLLGLLSKVALKQVDERTLKKYMNCITSYSVKNIQNGTFNVSKFCQMF